MAKPSVRARTGKARPTKAEPTAPTTPKAPPAPTESSELSDTSEPTAPGVRDTVGIVRSLRDEAAQYYVSDAATAQRLAKEAMRIAKSAGHSEALGWAQRALAEAHLFSGRLRESDGHYRRARAHWTRSRCSALVGELMVGHLHVLSHLGRIAEAEALAKRARRILRNHGNTAYLAKLAMNMGVMFFQRDRYPEALRECERAAELFDQLGQRDPTVISLEVNRGVALTQLDRHEDALRLFDRLLEETEAGGLELLAAQIRMNASVVQVQRAEYDLALPALGEATAYFRRTEHPAFLASCLLNRAETYQHLQMAAEAVDLAAEAETIFKQERMRYDAALAALQQGSSLLANGDPKTALRALARSKARFSREHNRTRTAVVELIRAEAYRDRGQYRDAKMAIEAAQAEFRRSRLTRWRTLAQTTALEIALDEAKREQDVQASVRSLRSLLRHVPEAVYPMACFRAWDAVGRAQAAFSQPKRAIEAYERALQLFESVRGRVPTEETKLSFLRGRTDAFDRALALLVQTDAPLADVFSMMERSRAQRLADRFHRLPRAAATGAPDAATVDAATVDAATVDAATVDAPAADATAKKTLATAVALADGDPAEHERRRLAWLHTRLASAEMGSPQERRRLPALRRDIEKAERRWRKLAHDRWERTIASRGTSAGHVSVGHAPVAMQEVVSALPSQWGFVSYHLTDDVAIALVAADGQIRRLDLASGVGESKTLNREITRFCERLELQWSVMALDGGGLSSSSPSAGTVADSADGAVASRSRDKANTILRALHERLWQPVEATLESMIGTRERMGWMVVPHGILHRVPFHALQGSEAALAERSLVSILPSATTWWQQRQQSVRRKGRAPRAWIAGLPSPRIPHVGAEVRQAAEHLAGWNVKSNLAPTRRNFLEAAEWADHLHLAAHSAVRSDNPAFSYVELSDGPLFAHDLETVDLDGATVVLSSCSSGRGQQVAGDEWVGLGQAFLQAGAREVVTSLWSVSDRATRSLMHHLYGHLVSGADLTSSLGWSMRSVASDNPHPWHWAPFAVVGGGPASSSRRGGAR